MASDSKLDMLHAIPLFARLSKPDLESVSQLADEVELPAGKVLMRQGETGAEMFVISAGRVKVERDGQQLADLGPGDWLGEMAILSEAPRMATATTSEPTRAFVVAHREFHSLMDRMPSVRSSVLDCVADRISRLEAGKTY